MQLGRVVHIAHHVPAATLLGRGWIAGKINFAHAPVMFHSSGVLNGEFDRLPGRDRELSGGKAKFLGRDSEGLGRDGSGAARATGRQHDYGGERQAETKYRRHAIIPFFENSGSLSSSVLDGETIAPHRDRRQLCSENVPIRWVSACGMCDLARWCVITDIPLIGCCDIVTSSGNRRPQLHRFA
jgi:hypothetical protein